MGASASRTDVAAVRGKTVASEDRVSPITTPYKYNVYFVHTGNSCAELAKALWHVAPYTDPELTSLGRTKSTLFGEKLRRDLAAAQVRNPMVCSSPAISAMQTAALMMNPLTINIVPHIGSRKGLFPAAKQREIIKNIACQPQLFELLDYSYFKEGTSEPNAEKFLEWFEAIGTDAFRIHLVVQTVLNRMKEFNDSLPKLVELSSYEDIMGALLLRYAIANNTYMYLESESIAAYLAPGSKTSVNNTQYYYILLRYLFEFLIDTVEEIVEVYSRVGQMQRQKQEQRPVSIQREQTVPAPVPASVPVSAPTPVRQIPISKSTRAMILQSLRNPAKIPSTIPEETLNNTLQQMMEDGASEGNIAAYIKAVEKRSRSAGAAGAGAAGAGAGAAGARSSRTVRLNSNTRRMEGGDRTTIQGWQIIEAAYRLKESLPHPSYVVNPADLERYMDAIANVVRQIDAKMRASFSRTFDFNTANAEPREMLGYPARIDTQNQTFVIFTHKWFINDFISLRQVKAKTGRKTYPTILQNKAYLFEISVKPATGKIDSILYDANFDYTASAGQSLLPVLYQPGLHKTSECQEVDICRKKTCGTRRRMACGPTNRRGGGKVHRSTVRRSRSQK